MISKLKSAIQQAIANIVTKEQALSAKIINWSKSSAQKILMSVAAMLNRAQNWLNNLASKLN